ncbi:TetR/AcrR family transcriptional regulator [Williamsia deligens]|uniref:TetR/AcrR family transcriptional regulator n=1 Tax=Williamsia deligens TaxID=321325 RepID=A0ABW3G9B8_9NOCA|nr:TetR/AcrR family transcriptional regulator [Williamsia deligens]MCP2193001.1 transcriptional regulator, TetR family [Williamsia deligens]
MRRSDPRPARSRAKLVDAAAGLVREHGPAAVTVDAVIGAADVSRATFYRHFASTTELVAAAFAVVMPTAPAPSATGSVHDRLTELVLAQARLIAEVPATTTVLAWLSLGVDLDTGSVDRVREGAEMLTLRERVADQFLRPFDEVLSSPDAVELLGDVDRVLAMSLLIGPLAMGRLSTLPSFDYEKTARAAVDGFVALHARER